jgi:TatD DNase family protein
MFIDTHAHIYLPQFEKDQSQMIARAVDVGVHKILMPNIDLDSVELMHQTEHRYPSICFSMMGLHPCSVGPNFEESLIRLKENLDTRDYIAIGEIGMDLYWDKSHVEEQVAAFKIQVGWAQNKSIPVVIHSRESTLQLIEILEELAISGLTGVFHCFSGTVTEAQRIIDLGLYLGIGGVVTFKNGGLDKVLPNLDLSNIILETDAPYLAPQPYRGKRNESAHLIHIANKVSALYDIPLSEVARITSANAITLFGELNQPIEGKKAS